MKKSDKKLNIIIRSAAFILAFILIFAFLEGMTYDYSLSYDGWEYVYRDNVEILIMGSSQADASFDAQYITEQTGKSTVILSSGAQGIKQLYYNLKEVLKYQQPELIVVEEFSIIEDTVTWMEENDVEGLALTNLDGMKMSPLKLWAAFSTLGFDGYGVFHIMRESGKTERFIYTLTHIKLKLRRLFNPKRKDMSPLRGSQLYNAETLATQAQYEASLLTEVDESYEIIAENLKYMEKVIKLCEKNGIDLEFIKTPLIKNSSSLSGHYVLVNYLEEEGLDIDAYNLMDDEYGLDMQKDDYSDINHVSASGMQKVSEWFVSHYKEKYE